MADQPQVANRAVDQLLQNAAEKIRDTLPGGGIRSAFGYGYADGVAKDYSYRASLYPQPAETYSKWIERVDRELPGFGDLMGQPTKTTLIGDQQNGQRRAIRTMIAAGKVQPFDEASQNALREQAKFADPDNLGKTEQTAADVSSASASDLLKAFAEHMTAPIDPADPAVQALVKTAGSAAQGDARARGLQGGYAVQNTEHGVTNALNQAYLARSQIGASALGQAGQLDLGQAQLAQQAYNQQYQAQLTGLQSAYASNRGAGQTIGGVIGGVAGGIASIYAPALAPQLISGGAQLGAGIGGMGAGSAPTLAYTPPSAMGSNRGGL